MQVKIGERHEVERNTSISMCQQLQHSASMSDDDLEYAADSAASPPRESESSTANGAASRQEEMPHADGQGKSALLYQDTQMTCYKVAWTLSLQIFQRLHKACEYRWAHAQYILNTGKLCIKH